MTSRVLRDMLAGYVSRGSTVFLTSHVLSIVEKLCTHVGIIAEGKLVEQASLEDIRRGCDKICGQNFHAASLRAGGWAWVCQ